MFLGRQAIFDRDARVVAYELLYRDSAINQAFLDDEEEATVTVLQNALVEFGLDAVAPNQDVFVNFSPEILGEEFAQLLPRERCVIEVLESVQPHAEVLRTLEMLREEGYRLALDDVVYEPRLDPLIERVDIVKLDLPLTADDRLEADAERILKFGVQLLAEKVEDHETRERCAKAGFDLFQGYFYCRPQVLEGRTLSLDRTHTLHVIGRMQDPNLSVTEASRLVRQDPNLSVKLLRFINSSKFSIEDPIESLEHAVSLVGLRKLKALATLMSLGSLADKPRELMITANTRGQMCELVGRELYGDTSGAYFVVGMFSLLDAFTDTPLEEILPTLPLSADVLSAILDHAGTLGAALQTVKAWERQEFSELPFSMRDVGRCYRNAVKRSEAMLSTLGA